MPSIQSEEFHQMNSALCDFASRWESDGDYLRCRKCKRPQLTNYMDSEFPHASFCKAQGTVEAHPWRTLMELLRPLHVAAHPPADAVQPVAWSAAWIRDQIADTIETWPLAKMTVWQIADHVRRITITAPAEASAPGLALACDAQAIRNAIDLAKKAGWAVTVDQLESILTRASAATVAEPSDEQIGKEFRKYFDHVTPEEALDALNDLRGKLKAAQQQAEPTCATCIGSGVVDDGEITGSGGAEFESGPIKCVKDCPDCVGDQQSEPADGPLNARSDAWIAVCNLLTEIAPGWLGRPGESGKGAALRVIRELSAKQPAQPSEEAASYKRMFEDAVRSLAAIDEALGIDPEDAGGAAPILEAIAALKAKANQQSDLQLVVVGWFTKWPDGRQSLRLYDDVTPSKIEYGEAHGAEMQLVYLLPWQADKLGLKWRPEDRKQEVQHG